MAKGASAVGKRSPRPRRAGGKKHPISTWAAYRASSTNSESPHFCCPTSWSRSPSRQQIRYPHR
jgi:hypothetical protein